MVLPGYKPVPNTLQFVLLACCLNCSCVFCSSGTDSLRCPEVSTWLGVEHPSLDHRADAFIHYLVSLPWTLDLIPVGRISDFFSYSECLLFKAHIWTMSGEISKTRRSRGLCMRWVDDALLTPLSLPITITSHYWIVGKWDKKISDKQRLQT